VRLLHRTGDTTVPVMRPRGVATVIERSFMIIFILSKVYL